MRHFQQVEAELARIDNAPMPLVRLAQIWRSLDEGERFSFLLCLEEHICENLIKATAPAQTPGRETK